MRDRLIGMALLVAAAMPSAAIAEDAAGNWLGMLHPSALVMLRLAVHIRADGHGGLQGTFDSLDENMTGTPLAEIESTPRTLSFKVPAVSGSYSGRWDAAAGPRRRSRLRAPHGGGGIRSTRQAMASAFRRTRRQLRLKEIRMHHRFARAKFAPLIALALVFALAGS